MGYNKKRKFSALLVHVALIAVCLICVFPVIWMTLISFKSVHESMTGFASILPSDPTVANYIRVVEIMPNLPWNFLNNVFVSIMGTVTTLFFCSLAGFAFAKYRFPGKQALFLFVLATMMVPQEIGIIPVFLIYRNLHLINSLWGLIIPRIATAVGIFYMTQYMRDVPTEVLEAARIDGCTDFRIYWQIVCPIVKSGLASWATLTMITRWNDFFWPLVLLRNAKKYTLMVAIALLPTSDGLSTPWPIVMSGTTLAVVPVVIAYFIVQKLQIANVTAGAVKG